MPSIPEISVAALHEGIVSLLPTASIEFSPINPEYKSWRLRVKNGNLDIEFVWGPLSGFGGRDMARPMTPDDTPFDYADEMFWSLDDALNYLKSIHAKYPKV
jgi:hypothetical protein